MVSFMIYSCGNIGGGITNDTSSSTNGGSPTLNGSYAKILKVGDFIYTIDREQLVTFKKVNGKLDQIDKQNVGFAIENIYSLNNLLFIGSERAMFIYKIDDEGIPKKRSETAYQAMPEVTACDPVIAQGDYAYVTLHTLTQEGGCSRTIAVNQLRIYDVKDIDNPVLLSTTTMNGPKGLGVKGDYLFVCDANEGVVVFDVSQKEKPVETNRISGFVGFDLIVNGDKLTVVGKKEIRQFDISNINDIKPFGVINL